MLTFFERGCLEPVAKMISPLGSLVRNLNDIELCLPVSHGGRTYEDQLLVICMKQYI